MSLKVKVKGNRLRSPGTKTAFFGLSAACVRFVFGKTSLASSFNCFIFSNYFARESGGEVK